VQTILRNVMRGSAIRLCAVLWLFGYALVVIGAMVEGRLANGMMIVANIPLLLLGIAQSVALSILLDRLESRAVRTRWAVMALAGLIAGLIQTAADDAWLRLLALTLVPSWQDWAVSYQPQRLAFIFLLYCWTMYLSVALVWAARANDVAYINRARAVAFADSASRAEAAALRLQLNPHFLFNTLNGITSLVVQGKGAQAEEMLGRLADFLRAALLSEPEAMIPLSQEIETLCAYLDIERARFGERLQIEITIDPAVADVMLPNFLLQPIVENAVKYGVANGSGPSSIRIEAKRTGDVVRIATVNAGAPGRSSGHGIGLNNVLRRLRLHYGGNGVIEHGAIVDGYRVAIDIPAAGANAARIAQVAA
jgi:two-component system LytT family sensor kinase